MQSVFNRGECIMHVDKNADGHVLDVDQILREIAYIPLNRGSGLNVVHACSLSLLLFFLFFFWEKEKKK